MICQERRPFCGLSRINQALVEQSRMRPRFSLFISLSDSSAASTLVSIGNDPTDFKFAPGAGGTVETYTVPGEIILSEDDPISETPIAAVGSGTNLSLEDGTVLFSLKFDVIGNGGDATDLTFVYDPETSVFFYGALPPAFGFADGSVSLKLEISPSSPCWVQRR